jgi:signal transduction histidine kinase
MFRTLTAPQLAVDIVVGAVFFVLVSLVMFGGPVWGGGSASTGWLVLVVLGMSIALTMRRLAPGAALAVAWVIAIVQMAAQVVPNPADVATFAVVYTAAAYGSPRTRWLSLASAVVAPAAITGYILFTQGIGELAMCVQFQYSYCASYVPDLAVRGAGWFVAFAFAYLLAWATGQLVRTRIRARQSREAMLAAEQEVAAEQERTRIARDMHDVVAHSLAVVVAQADGARYAARTDPAAAEEALRTIAATAREALGDVRVLLAQLRHRQEDGPQPTLNDLDHLLEQLRASGLLLVRDDEGEPLPLGTSQQIAVYRIVQESLTNALRHADTDREVHVRFRWSSHGLELAVVSALPEVKARTGMIPVAASASASGHGIAGMTERATLAGGWLRAGADQGRFVVTAWLPYQPTGAHAPIVIPSQEEPAR